LNCNSSVFYFICKLAEDEYMSEETEDIEEDDLAEDDSVPMGPSEQQLTNVSFEENRHGRFSAILVDGENYRYNLYN
jgi:hypothetical protein